MNKKKRKRPQRSKRDRYNHFPVNEVSDGLFDYGHKDGGHDNWIPVKDRYYYDFDRSNFLNTSNAKALISKERKKDRYT